MASGAASVGHACPPHAVYAMRKHTNVARMPVSWGTIEVHASTALHDLGVNPLQGTHIVSGKRTLGLVMAVAGSSVAVAVSVSNSQGMPGWRASLAHCHGLDLSGDRAHTRL